MLAVVVEPKPYMQQITISDLESIQDVYDLVRDNFLDKRNEFKKSSEQFEIAINDIDLGVINLSSLTMLICLLYSVRKHYKFPFIGTIYSQRDENYFADKRKSSYLKSVGFFDLTRSLRIIQWYLPKKIDDQDFNPTTGIDQLDIYQISPEVKKYYKIDGLDPYDKELILLNILKERHPHYDETELQLEYDEVKTRIKNDIKKFLASPTEDLFSKISQGRTFKNNVVSYVSEILLNSFIHGREKPFLAIQRTNKLISVSVADDGAGLEKSYFMLHKAKIKNSKEAIIKACAHRRNSSYGLFDVLSDSHHGFFTISDGSNILKITRNNYHRLASGEIIESIHDTKLNIRGVRISLDILIK